MFIQSLTVNHFDGEKKNPVQAKHWHPLGPLFKLSQNRNGVPQSELDQVNRIANNIWLGIIWRKGNVRVNNLNKRKSNQFRASTKTKPMLIYANV